MIQEENHIFQGLKRDNHQIKQDPQFLWDAHNIRITNREDNTLFSITNEKGTSPFLLSLKEYYVGHCVLGKYLIVFTATEDDGYSYIYRIEKVNKGYKTIILYQGYLMLNPKNPIEAISVYETELIQKVYWVDGKNQPRVINIAKPELKVSSEYIVDGINFQGPKYSENTEINNYLSNVLGIKGLYEKDSFDFCQSLSLQEKVDVYRTESSGMFSPGTIQYALSYYNKYGQETNIFYVTPIQYISPKDRGGNPEEPVSNIFTIEIQGHDLFDYIRVYSIHRTSIDAVPLVKVVDNIPLSDDPGDSVKCVDDGTKGYTIDPTQLLYIGGKSIIADTIEQKDGTLFLGNINVSNQNKKFDDIIKPNIIRWNKYNLGAVSSNSTISTYYDYNNSLSQGYSAGFKSNELYRCGIQVQTKEGIWSDPIFLEDKILCDEHPLCGFRYSKSVTLKSKQLIDAGIKRVRSCIVFPRTFERDVICQGVLCPTVYSVAGRNADNPYAMASWFFRPAMKDIENVNNSSDIYHGASIEYRHNRALFAGNNRGAEIQSMKNDISNINNVEADTLENYKNYFFVDENIVTLNSPDLEFDTQLFHTDWSNVELRIIGIAELGAISGDIDIQTSSPTLSSEKNDAIGFVHNVIGYQTRNNKNINGGLVSGLFYNSGVVDEDFKVNDSDSSYFMVYPWNRSGSLNNDSNRPAEKGIRSAVLSKKKISNLKFFDKNSAINSILEYKISTPKLFYSDTLDIEKITPYYLSKDIPYMGNIDTLVTSNSEYPFYTGSNFITPSPSTVNGKSSNEHDLISISKDPVRIKYKSVPHLVFSLSDNYNSIQLLPRHKYVGNTLNQNFYTFPDWQNSGSTDGSNDNKGLFNDDIKLIGVSKMALLPSTFWRTFLGQKVVLKYLDYYLIATVDSYSNGNLYFNGIEEDNVIFRVKSGYTLSNDNSILFEGMTSKDWNKDSYIGKTRYYKAVINNRGGIVLGNEKYNGYTLEEVTDDINTKTETTRANTSSIYYSIKQDTFTTIEDKCNPYLLLAEIVKKVPESIKFGGLSDEALKANLWIPASEAISITEEEVTIPFIFGDTWYSRYDCLKTYPFTQEDENQVIEIGSFMCETRVNIDGRYDRNRGQMSNLNMTPQNFNLLNEVYNQKDNYFNYRIYDEDYYKQNIFSNQITWSKEKNAGEEIDTWTNITLANTLDMPGDKGKVTSIKAFNENLVCFQEKALSQIMFNSRVQIPVTDGVPIEISNGYKVDGSRFISDKIGCSNKWSIINTSMGIYFIDSNSDSLYIFNGQINNLSKERGMDWWVKQSNPSIQWFPFNESRVNGIRTFFDNKYGDVYFTPGPVVSNIQPDALCYSESVGQFTSLMSYGGTQAMFNFNDGFYSLREDGNTVKLYQNNIGDYNNFFGEIKGWDISFISNQNPTITKIFDTIELRTDCYWTYVTEQLLNKFPFNIIEADNEYQHTGKIRLTKNMTKKKFRVWRCLIPRSSKVASAQSNGSDIDRHYGRARIRNPWTMIKLGWEPTHNEQPGELTNKAIIHDISVKYTV